MSITCSCGSVKETHDENGSCKMCSCPEWRECYHTDSRMECLSCTSEREFKRGMEFAIDIIKKALVDNPDIPFIAFETAEKVLKK